MLGLAFGLGPTVGLAIGALVVGLGAYFLPELARPRWEDRLGSEDAARLCKYQRRALAGGAIGLGLIALASLL